MRFLVPLLSLLLLPLPVSAQAPKPNILFILVDDMGWGDLGVFWQDSRTGSQKFDTPKLDQFAADGLQMRRHYCPAPVCAPARASLLLGVHQGHSNVRNSQFDKALEDNHTIGTVMQEAGYATSMIGKYGLHGGGGAPAHPHNRGFDHFFGYLAHLDAHYHYPKEGNRAFWDGTTDIRNDLDKCYSTDLLTARAKKWITDHNTATPTQPFFLYLALPAPHAGLRVPTNSHLTATDNYPTGGGTTGGVQWVGTPGAMINTAAGTFDTGIHPDYSSTGWPNYAQRHASMIRRIDNAVDDLVQLLKDLNLDDDTLVVFTSDNGTHNEGGADNVGTYNPTFFDTFGPLEGIKRDTLDGGIRMPTLARWPGTGGIPAASLTQSPSQFHDWMATFAELAGVPSPARCDGVSLVPTLTGAGTQQTSNIYLEFNNGGNTPGYSEFTNNGGDPRNEMQVVFLDGYKGLRTNTTSHAVPFRIYDTETDLAEATNLAGTNAFFTDLGQRMLDRVLQTRRAGGGTSRSYDSVQIPPAPPASTVAGLEFRTFEDTYPWVPDFTPLTETTTGNSTGLDLSVRTRDDDIGLEFTGFLTVPAAGSYQFYLTTDTRAFVRIHDAALIDADFGYTGGSEATSGSIPLAAGLHPIRISYARGTVGTPSLTLEWSGPGLPREIIPDSSLRRSGVVAPGPPEANDDSATTNGSTTASGTPVVINALINDIDDGTPSPLTITDPGNPLHGTAAIDPGGILYTPNQGFFGTETFTYTITDGADTDSATISITVHPVGDFLWVPFDETTGSLAHDAGDRPIGTLAAFPGDDSQWIDGNHCGALDFNGADEQVTIDPALFVPPLGADSRTFTAWLKPDASQPEFAGWLSYGTNSNGQRMTLRTDANRLRCEVQGGFAVATTNIADGNWHHVAVVINNATPNVNQVQFYVDGTFDPITSSGSRVINTTAGSVLTVGGSSHSGSYNFAGAIDDVRIYPSALSAAEIQALEAREACQDTWYFRQLGEPEPTMADWNADLDLDGWSAFAEFALGGQPHGPDPQIAPTLAPGGPFFEFTFNRRRSGIDPARYIPEASPDLLPPWLPLGGPSVAPHPTLSDFDQVTVPLPDTGAPSRFVRLKIN